MKGQILMKEDSCYDDAEFWRKARQQPLLFAHIVWLRSHLQSLNVVFLPFVDCSGWNSCIKMREADSDLQVIENYINKIR